MRNTKYAYDPVNKVPVFIGNREDWTYRQNYRWYDPTRENPEIADHQRWGKEYVCCHDPLCAIPVEAAQGPKQAWHFRRIRYDRRKPSFCRNHSEYSGESSFHWKTAFNIEKLLLRKQRQGEQWLGKDIAFVQREQARFFAIGEQGVRLRPDVFVMFADGDWLAIEIVYTHRPEMEHHEAYAPLANGDDQFGSRVVVIDLNDELPVINDETHRLWVREGGTEDAMARESKEASRMARYEERKSHFDGRLAVKRLRSKNRFITQIEREFPDFTWSQPPPIDATLKETEQAFVAQRREQLRRAALKRDFEACVLAHDGREYGLLPESFDTKDAMEQAFDACFKEMSRRHEGIVALNDRFTFLNIPSDFMDERSQQFDDWLTKMEASAAKCQSALEAASMRAVEAGCDETDICVLDAIILDHETKDVHDYKTNIEAYVDETIRGNHFRVVEAKVGEFKKATGIDVSNHNNGFTCQELADIFDLDELTTWLNEVETYLQTIDTATTEALRELDQDVGLEERLRAKIQSEINFSQSADLDGIPYFIEQSVNEGMLQYIESNIRSNLGTVLPATVLDHFGRDPKALRSWMERANDYHRRCESHRQSAIRVAQQEGKSALCLGKIRGETLPYDISLNVDSFRSTLDQIVSQYGGGGTSQGRQTSTSPTRRRTRNNQARTVSHILRHPTGNNQPLVEPSDIEGAKVEINNLIDQKDRQISVLRDPKRTKKAKKGAKSHLNRIKKEIRKAKAKLDQLEAKEARSLLSGKIRDAEKLLSESGGVRGVHIFTNVRPAPFNKNLNGKVGDEFKGASKKQKHSERLRDLQSRSEDTKKQVNQILNGAGDA